MYIREAKNQQKVIISMKHGAFATGLLWCAVLFASATTVFDNIKILVMITLQ